MVGEVLFPVYRLQYLSEISNHMHARRHERKILNKYKCYVHIYVGQSTSKVVKSSH